MNINNEYLFEGCIDSITDADHYHLVGIDRLEICDRLDLGGTCPSIELVDHCINKLHIDSVIMLRLRDDFVFRVEDLPIYSKYITKVRALGAKNFIFGFNIKGKIDVIACQQLIALLDGCNYAFHMAIDNIDNYELGLKTVIDLKFKWVLTKGGNNNPALQNLTNLKHVIDTYGHEINFLIGGKVDSQNWQQIAQATGATWFHGKKIK